MSCRVDLPSEPCCHAQQIVNATTPGLVITIPANDEVVLGPWDVLALRGVNGPVAAVAGTTAVPGPYVTGFAAIEGPNFHSVWLGLEEQSSSGVGSWQPVAGLYIPGEQRLGIVRPQRFGWCVGSHLFRFKLWNPEANPVNVQMTAVASAEATFDPRLARRRPTIEQPAAALAIGGKRNLGSVFHCGSDTDFDPSLSVSTHGPAESADSRAFDWLVEVTDASAGAEIHLMGTNRPGVAPVPYLIIPAAAAGYYSSRQAHSYLLQPGGGASTLPDKARESPFAFFTLEFNNGATQQSALRIVASAGG